MEIKPLADAPFGAVVSAFDCARADTETADRLRLALHQHEVLVFPGQQHLSPADEVAFYRSIDLHGNGVWRDQRNNPWEVFKVQQGNLAGTYQLPDEPAVLVLGKGDIDHCGLRVRLGGDRSAYGRDRGSQVLGGGALQWHIDGPFYAHPPCHYTQMRCIEAPASSGHWLDYGDGSDDRLWCPSGSTAFASGRIAYQRLSAEQRALSREIRVHYASRPFEASYALGNSSNGLRLLDAEAEAAFQRGVDAEGNGISDPLAQVYPLIWSCEITGRHALMPQPRCMHALEQNSSAGSRFLGVVESRQSVERWMRPAIDPDCVYVHAWQPGDLVIWNNRSVWHSATGKLTRDDRRIMHLTAFNGATAPQLLPD